MQNNVNRGDLIIIGKGVKLNNVTIEITGNHNTLIINDNSVIAEKGKILIKDFNNTVQIGRNADIRGVFIASSDINTKIDIGDNALISSQVVIRSSDVHSIIDAKGIKINHGKDVFIGNYVWIGYGSTILKGTVVNSNSVVGSQTLLSNIKIPSGSVVAGHSGKIIKSNISWRKERINEN